MPFRHGCHDEPMGSPASSNPGRPSWWYVPFEFESEKAHTNCTLPAIGHEGVGEIVKMGPGTEKSERKVGDRVGIKSISAACGSCAACLNGNDGVCFNQKISGYYTPGTFQQYVLGPADYVTPIPENLDSAMAAPMLCAGMNMN